MCRLNRSRWRRKPLMKRPAVRKAKKPFPKPLRPAKPSPYANRRSARSIALWLVEGASGCLANCALRTGLVFNLSGHQSPVTRHSACQGRESMNRSFQEMQSQGVIDPRLNYRDYQRQRMLTLGDLLLENRIILLQGEIYDGNASEVVMKLLYLQSENRRKDIHFYLNSPGGSVTATLAVYDTMQILTCPVATYCVGLCASGAAVLLAGGTKSKRYALPHAKVMIHQPYGQVGGQVSDIEIQANEIYKTRDVLNRILADHTGQPIE